MMHCLKRGRSILHQILNAKQFKWELNKISLLWKTENERADNTYPVRIAEVVNSTK